MPSQSDEKRLVTSWKDDKLVVQEKTYEHGGWVNLRQYSEEDLKKLNRLARLIPGGLFRKIFVRLFIANNQRINRKYVGNFQITSLSSPLGEYHIPNLLATAFLLSVGGISKRVMAINDKTEVRLSVYIVSQIDHRILDGVKPFKFLLEVKDILEHPEKLT